MIKLSIQEMHRLDVQTFQQASKRPVQVVLDNVRSQYNVGSVFRTCDAFRIEKICLCGICSCPPDKEIHKTALGAEQTVAWQHYDKTEEAVISLKAQGYTIWGVEQAHHSVYLETINREKCPKKVAVIFGHEVFGIQEPVLELCDAIIEIPQYGTKHSLNVSVTAGIVLYQIASFFHIK